MAGKVWVHHSRRKVLEAEEAEDKQQRIHKGASRKMCGSFSIPRTT
jgi:hypothetical protein